MFLPVYLHLIFQLVLVFGWSASHTDLFCNLDTSFALMTSLNIIKDGEQLEIIVNDSSTISDIDPMIYGEFALKPPSSC